MNMDDRLRWLFEVNPNQAVKTLRELQAAADRAGALRRIGVVHSENVADQILTLCAPFRESR